MKKVLKIFGIILSIVLGIVIVFLAVSVINNKVCFDKESKLDQPLGKIVMVDGHRMSVYSEGTGSNTLVFLTGSGTSSPILDFKSLYSKLSSKNRIVVVEPFGYGFSDTTNEPKDLDTVLRETRMALSEAGEKGPYILFPHSVAGLEAIYWAQKYPAEVKAIVGLDPAVPETYAGMTTPNMIPFYFQSFLVRIGVLRFIPSICNSSDAIKAGQLTDQEDKIYRTVFYRKTLSTDMLNEITAISGNIKIVSENSIPTHTPMLFFASNGGGTGISTANWRRPLSNYISKISNGKIVFLNCGHYVQDYEPTEISEKSQSFIDSLSNK